MQRQIRWPIRGAQLLGQKSARTRLVAGTERVSTTRMNTPPGIPSSEVMPADSPWQLARRGKAEGGSHQICPPMDIWALLPPVPLDRPGGAFWPLASTRTFTMRGQASCPAPSVRTDGDPWHSHLSGENLL